MADVRLRGCAIAGKRDHVCLGPTTFHHLRFVGSPKDDTWGIGLCAWAHLHTFNSRTSVEALGKAKFEEYWGISLIDEAQKNRDAFAG